VPVDITPAVPEPETIVAPPRGLRSDRIHSQVLEATAALLREGGYSAATMDAIAQRAGVSKVTLYKHWPSRTAVAAKAFGLMMADALPQPNTGTSAGDLTEQVLHVSEFYASDLGGVFAQLIAACVEDPAGAAYFGEFFLAGRRAAVAELWARAVERGDARPGVDVNDVIDTLFGALLFRLLIGHQPLSAEAAASLADVALRGTLLPTAKG